MKRQNYSQMKKQEKTPGKINKKKTEISSLLDKEFKTLVIKMSTELGERTDLTLNNFRK